MIHVSEYEYRQLRAAAASARVTGAFSWRAGCKERGDFLFNVGCFHCWAIAARQQ